MPAGQLCHLAWGRLTREYLDREVIRAIIGICLFGARIGYEGELSTITIHQNSSTAFEFPEVVTTEIQAELTKHRRRLYTSYNQLPRFFTASPLGLTDKSDGTKRCIHHLSYSENSSHSVNGGIPELYGTITYSTVSDAIMAIQSFGIQCQLVKHDFESAFRHIPVSPIDSQLLGLHWQNIYYEEQFLPFGLRTAPYLFNLFADIFHWILEDQLQGRRLPAKIVHYLDDFLIILPSTADLISYSKIFNKLAEEVGLAIKESKNEEGTVASFGEIEIDTEKMIIRLPTKKLLKARQLVQTTMNQTSLLLRELQQITGYLNFVATVVPLGRTFLRRLYNMQLHFPTERKHFRRRISIEAYKDLRWWSRVLARAPEQSIQKQTRSTISMWSDAAGTKGLRAFYIDNNLNLAHPYNDKPSPQSSSTHPGPRPGSAFSITLPTSVTRAREHINTKEMRAVEQALLHWGRK